VTITGTWAARSQPPGRPPRRAKPSSSIGPWVSAKRSGEKKIGSHPSPISAARATFFGPIAAR
jgi:hypothetical protein